LIKFDREVDDIYKKLLNWLQEQNKEVETSYIDNYGNICPHCLKKMKVYNNEIKNILTISHFLVNNKTKAILYCLCMRCFKHLRDFTLDYNKIENNVLEAIKK